MRLVRVTKRGWSGLVDLLYPRFCLGCDRTMGEAGQSFICLPCAAELPFTHYHELPENPVTDRFAGRLPLFFGGAFLIYKNDSITQRMIAQLKYYNRPDVALGLGRLYGDQLAGVPSLADLDYLVPVPLHPKRRFERGYNQAERIAAGIAEKLPATLAPAALLRNTFEASQTKKNKEERFANVSTVFRAGSLNLNGKKVLLIDDVLTTGATLEACAEALLAAYPEARIGIATLGIRE